jgi:hypothetical protein
MGDEWKKDGSVLRVGLTYRNAYIEFDISIDHAEDIQAKYPYDEIIALILENHLYTRAQWYGVPLITTRSSTGTTPIYPPLDYFAIPGPTGLGAVQPESALEYTVYDDRYSRTAPIRIDYNVSEFRSQADDRSCSGQFISPDFSHDQVDIANEKMWAYVDGRTIQVVVVLFYRNICITAKTNIYSSALQANLDQVEQEVLDMEGRLLARARSFKAP